MEDLTRGINPECQQLDIYVKRILAKYVKEEQILFDEENNIKYPIKLCIKKKGANTTDVLDDYGIKCIKDVFITDIEATQEIICTTKAKLIIKFKVVLWVIYEDNTAGFITVPSDDVCIKTTLPEIIDGEKIELVNGKFVWTKFVKLTEFDAPIPPECLDDPTLQSHLIIKGVRAEYEVLGDCTCSEKPGTEVLLSVFANILDKLGVDQDILIHGIPLDC
ncbi:MAG: hypothetical protein N2594_01440 [Clostridiales bacterium]|nr:hypothetical protein [Clostridiales bacterium]